MVPRGADIIDISMPLAAGMETYPGNPPFRAAWQRTATTYLTALSLGTHAGTHVDAPRHVRRDGASVDALDLSRFIGPCRVLDLTRCRDAIRIADLRPKRVRAGERILLKTENSSHPRPTRRRGGHVFLDGDAAEYLAARGILLVGIDALSIKQRGGDDVRPHTAFLHRGIPIVEGLRLAGVPEGRYGFVGLPLRLRGREGSPIRAVLIRRAARRKRRRSR